MHTKILVVDDEESICEILKYNLEAEGYYVDTANSAEQALHYDLPSYSLMILDVMMDKLSGFDFAQRLKNSYDTENIPILFCSALSGEDERIMGLNIGADDYVVKPFMVREVMARVRSVLRRAGKTKHFEEQKKRGLYSPDIIIGRIRIDRNNKQIYVDGVDTEVTKTEYELFLFLINNPNTILSRQQIISKVWTRGVSTFRTIDTTVTRLRKKLGTAGNCIITRLGYGYGFKKEF
ncbi:MAG: response regulator transcription factor [Muribaculaceae bacterium]|nr:response regulator transcription factor [Muribaculaceae bacterium]